MPKPFTSSSHKLDAERFIDEFIQKDVRYIIALYPFLYLYADEINRRRNVIDTLEPAFGKDVAEEVYREIASSFKDISLYTSIIENGREMFLRDYLIEYLLKEDTTKYVINEIRKRLDQISEEDRRILSIASAVINKIMNIGYPGLSIKYTTNIFNFISITSTNQENFSSIVSPILGSENYNLRKVFYKYLLGFQGDVFSGLNQYYALLIYPFAISYINNFASKISEYIKIPDKSEIKLIIEELYQREEYVKLGLLMHSLYYGASEPKYIANFAGKTREQLCKEVHIGNIFYKCQVNPLIYEDVIEIITKLYHEALDNLIEMFREIFEKHGYIMRCSVEHCSLTKHYITRSIHICFYPWPTDLPFLESSRENIKVLVIQGVPSQSILQSYYLQQYGVKGYLWLFLDKKKHRIIIASPTYSAKDHYELLSILKNYFSLEVIGYVTKGLDELLNSV
jgi:hypothetical protein